MTAVGRPTIRPDRLARFLAASFTLDQGAHESFGAGHCATEAGAWLVGEPHTDQPRCMSDVVARFLRTLNDRSSHELRQTLKPYVIRAVHTVNDDDDERLVLCRRWLLRHGLPPALELAGCDERATRLREAAETSSLEDVRRLVHEARVEAWGLRDRAFRTFGQRHPPAQRLAADRGTAAATAAAAPSAAGAAVASESVKAGPGFLSDGGSYADAASALAGAVAGTYTDAAAFVAYAAHSPHADLESIREPSEEAAGTALEPLSRLHDDGLVLLDEMLTPGGRSAPAASR